MGFALTIIRIKKKLHYVVVLGLLVTCLTYDLSKLVYSFKIFMLSYRI